MTPMYQSKLVLDQGTGGEGALSASWIVYQDTDEQQENTARVYKIDVTLASGERLYFNSPYRPSHSQVLDCIKHARVCHAS